MSDTLMKAPPGLCPILSQLQNLSCRKILQNLSCHDKLHVDNDDWKSAAYILLNINIKKRRGFGLVPYARTSMPSSLLCLPCDCSVCRLPWDTKLKTTDSNLDSLLFSLCLSHTYCVWLAQSGACLGGCDYSLYWRRQLLSIGR